MSLVETLIFIVAVGLFIWGAYSINTTNKKKQNVQVHGGNSQTVNYGGSEEVGGAHSHHTEMVEDNGVNPNEKDDPKPSELLD